MFKRLLSRKKTALFFLIGVGIFASLHIIWAQTNPQDLANKGDLSWMVKLAYYIVVNLVFGIGYIAYGLAVLGQTFLAWILDPAFTTLSYTTPQGNSLIAAGLSITRNLVNMFLVAVLVYIAVATILRLAGYNTKKLLITFVIVALLVNFSAVICGLFVDAANIIMNYFLTGGGSNQQIRQYFVKPGEYTVYNLNKLLSDATNQWDKAPEITNQVVVAALKLAGLESLAGIVVFIVFVVLGVLFLLRYMMIWILVILSPIAFVSYILPETKKRIWDEWWKQFINWTFIGVYGLFFLWLAESLSNSIEKQSVFSDPSGRTGVGVSFLPIFTIIIMYIIALVMTFKSSATGSSTAIGLAKKAMLFGAGAVTGAVATGAAGGKWVGKQFWENKVRPSVEPAARRAVNWATEKTENIPFLRHMVPAGARRFGQMRKPLDAAATKQDVYDSPTIGRRAARGADKGMDAAGGLLRLSQKGDTQDWFNEFKRETGVKSDAELLHNDKFKKITGDALTIADKGGYLSDIVRGDPRFAAIAASAGLGSYTDTLTDPHTGKKEQVPMRPEHAIRKATDDMRRGHLARAEKQLFENDTVVESLMYRERPILEGIADVKQGPQTFSDTLDRNFSKFVDSEKLAHSTTTDIDDAWKKYQGQIEQTSKRKAIFFDYVDTERAKEYGFRRADYIDPQGNRHIGSRGLQVGTQTGTGSTAGSLQPGPSGGYQIPRTSGAQPYKMTPKRRKTPNTIGEEMGISSTPSNPTSSPTPQPQPKTTKRKKLNTLGDELKNE